MYPGRNKKFEQKTTGFLNPGKGPVSKWVFGNPNFRFNAPFYGYGLWLDLRQIIRDVHYYQFKKKRYRRAVSALG